MELIEDLMKQDPMQKLILGNISKGWKPVRNPKSKYFITEAQYAEENYPDFATGPSYLVSKAAVEPLVETALGQLYIHLEDVFITGVVAEKLGVERRNNDQFKNNAVRVPARFMGCTLLHTITIHKVTPHPTPISYFPREAWNVQLNCLCSGGCRGASRDACFGIQVKLYHSLSYIHPRTSVTSQQI